jgi:hypothetical protein
MSRLQRNTTKVNCQYCGEEFTANGIKMHERNCSKKPEDAEVEEVTEEEELEEEVDAVEEDESDEDESEEDELLEDDTIPVRCLVTQSLFHFTGYINLKAGEVINLEKSLAKDMIRKNLVEIM